MRRGQLPRGGLHGRSAPYQVLDALNAIATEITRLQTKWLGDSSARDVVRLPGAARPEVVVDSQGQVRRNRPWPSGVAAMAS